MLVKKLRQNSIAKAQNIEKLEENWKEELEPKMGSGKEKANMKEANK